MCCACRLCLKCILMPINGCYLTIGIIALIFFGFFKWGVSLFLNFITSLMQNNVPGGLASNVKQSDLATLLQPYFDIVAWVLLGVAVVFLALGIFGISATCCPKCCRCFGWAYIGILGAALIALVVLLIIWFVTASARVAAIKNGLKEQINSSFQDFWQLSINNVNLKALAFNFVNVQFNCKFTVECRALLPVVRVLVTVSSHEYCIIHTSIYL